MRLLKGLTAEEFPTWVKDGISPAPCRPQEHFGFRRRTATAAVLTTFFFFGGRLAYRVPLSYASHTASAVVFALRPTSTAWWFRCARAASGP